MRSTDDSTHVLTALGSGFAGAVALTAIHETVRRVRPDDAPRMDVLGRRAIARGMEAVGIEPPGANALETVALAGDLLTNAAYYALIGAGSPKHVYLRGAALGLAAGIGGVVLPPLLGLGSAPSRRTRQTKAMTIAWYLAGGLAVAAVYSMVKREERR